ncbi:MAG: hypothetical protein KI788_09790 [Mameliella sp.]|nr:hypothetical protein [Mameliella sp.]
MDDIKKILALRPETLAKEQRDALAKYAADRLRMIAGLIEAGKYEEASKHTDESPAGDDHGCDNTFITFPELDDERSTYDADIGTVLSELERLNSVVVKAGKKR